MDELKVQEAVLNIWYYLPEQLWEKIPTVYESMPGWLGFGKDGFGEDGIPYWFSCDKDNKTISASVEPSGLLITGRMEDAEWSTWLKEFKATATKILGFKVGETENGEVGYEVEYLK